MKAGKIRTKKEMKVKKTEGKFGRFLRWFILLLFLAAVFLALFFSGFLEIIEIKTEGTREIKKEAVLGEIKRMIDEKYFNFISKNNLLLFRKNQAGEILMDKFKRIESLNIIKKFPNTLEIYINERSSLLILCGQNDCFIIDQKGRAYQKADFESEELKENTLTILQDEGGKSIEIGQEILKKDYLDFVLNLKDKLKSSFDLEIEKEMKTPSRASSDIRAKTLEGWMIYFNKDITLEKELDMLRVVLDNKIPGEQRANLEYIDLRSDNKVYYKFEEGTQVEPEAEEKKVEEQPRSNKKDEKKKK